MSSAAERMTSVDQRAACHGLPMYVFVVEHADLGCEQRINTAYPLDMHSTPKALRLCIGVDGRQVSRRNSCVILMEPTQDVLQYVCMQAAEKDPASKHRWSAVQEKYEKNNKS